MAKSSPTKSGASKAGASKPVAKALKQSGFRDREQEVVLALRVANARLLEPWEKFLKAEYDLSTHQYNALRILRGSHPTRLSCTEIASRMISRDPDVTRLVDRLSARKLVDRERSETDRRVVEVGISAQGLQLLKELDVHVQRMPKAMVGGLGAKKLATLATLLNDLLTTMGTFP